jgi:hypothetical protein
MLLSKSSKLITAASNTNRTISYHPFCLYATNVSPERERPLWRPRCRWENNIKMILREILWGNVDWIDLVQNWYCWRAQLHGLTSCLLPLQRKRTNLEVSHIETGWSN